MTDAPWRWISASVAGTSHLDSGLECQDNHVCKLINTDGDGSVLVAIVSDGAGSASKSSLGSRLICDVLTQKISEFFEENGKIQHITSRLVANWINSFRDEIILQAETDGVSDREYACTVLGVIAGRDASAAFQVGDGAVVYSTSRSCDVPVLAFWPERGEYENTTYFATQACFFDQLQFFLINEKIVEVALFSDGLQRLALDYQKKAPHQPFFAGLFRPLRLTDEPRIPDLNIQLIDYLNSDRINQRTDDDKTLLLATCLPHQSLASEDHCDPDKG